MNGFPIFPILFIALICGGGWYLHDRKARADAFESAESGVRQMRSEIKSLTDRIENAKQKLAPLREAKKGADTKSGSSEEALASIEALKLEVRKANAEWDRSTAEFEANLASVRQKATEKEWPEITLASGEVLKKCKIKKFTGNVVSIEHSIGNNRIRPEDLPEDWTARFSLDYVPDSTTDAKLAQEADEVSKAQARTVTLAVDQSVFDVQIEALDARLLELSHTVQDRERVAHSELRNAYREAAGGGNPGEKEAASSRESFRKSKAATAEAESIRNEYRQLRKERQELIRRRHAAILAGKKPK